MPDNARPAVQRVLMTADAVGGVWTYVTELVGVLATRGVQVLIATMGSPLNAAQRAPLAQMPGVQIAESTFKLEWMDDPWRDVTLAAGWLLELERDFEPQVVHLNGYVHAALPWRAPRLVVGHSCVCSWFEAVRGRSAPPIFRAYTQRVRRGLRAAEAVTAPTHHMLAALHRQYGPFRRRAPIYNGRSRALYAGGPREPLVLTVGRLWDEAKNIAAIDRAAAALEWPVFAAGPRTAPNGYSAEFRHLKLLGSLDEHTLAQWYGRAALVALPARYEPFGLAALEAALSGCALVLGDTPSLREVWSDAAVYVPPDDVAALTQTIRALMTDEGARQRLACRARERAVRYTPEQMANGYLNAYAALHAGHRERAATHTSQSTAGCELHNCVKEIV